MHLQAETYIDLSQTDSEPPPVFPSLLALFCDVSFSPCRYLEMDVFTEKGSRVEGMGGPRERGAGLILINDCLALRRFSQ